ncbi:hypothetical protein STEG23_034528 [Scotinomys teguina]
MAVMLLPGMKGLLLLVQRTITRTIVLQESISKDDWIPQRRFHMDYVVKPLSCLTPRKDWLWTTDCSEQFQDG